MQNVGKINRDWFDSLSRCHPSYQLHYRFGPTNLLIIDITKWSTAVHTYFDLFTRRCYHARMPAPKRELVQPVRDLYQQGLSTRQISKKLGVSKSYVHLHTQDISRPRNEALRLAQPPFSDSWRARRDQARKKVSRHLGRKLDRLEFVHHIDGNYHNNDLSNLQIVTPKEHSDLHTTIHDPNHVPPWAAKLKHSWWHWWITKGRDEKRRKRGNRKIL